MRIRMLVNCSNFLEDIDVDLVLFPGNTAGKQWDASPQSKGLTITRGFTSKVRKLAGGSKGCTHLLELLLAMAPAVFQGVAAHRSRTPSGANSEHTKLILKYLLNTCHAWREDGPFVAMHKKLAGMK